MLFGRVLSYSSRAPMYMGPGVHLNRSVRTYSRMRFQQTKLESDLKRRKPVQHSVEAAISSFWPLNLYTRWWRSKPSEMILLTMSLVTSPISSTRVRSVERLHGELRQRIVDGTYAPGIALSQVTLAQELGVSRTPLREALRRLEAEGLIESEQNRRMRVREIHPEEIDVMLTERILIETMGIKVSAAKFTEDDLEVLHLQVAAMRVSLERNDAESWDRAHTNFHHGLVRYASPKLRESIDMQVERAERYRRQFAPMPYTLATFNPEFTQILEACVIRDAELAARRVARKLSRTALMVLAQVSPEYEPHAIRAALTMLRADALEETNFGSIQRTR
jgi:DNA-binding GntR family transcriptional regulator